MSWEDIRKNSYRDNNPYNLDDMIDTLRLARKQLKKDGRTTLLNKIDDISMEELDILDQIPHYVPVSAHLEWNLDDLVERCWEYLALIR